MKPQDLIGLIKNKFGEKILEISEPVSNQVYFTISKEAVRPLSECLFKELNARFVISAGTDLGNTNHKEKFSVLHIFSLDQKQMFVSLRILLQEKDLSLDSITPLIPAAGWAEREFKDMMGLEPLGHPDPRRLVLSDDWPEGVYPLRKDIPYDYKPPLDLTAAPKLKPPPPGSTVLPIGPFFPVLEEPVYFRVFVEGERVKGCDYRGFYNHRGVEKLGDSVLTYNQIPFLAERICGICGFTHSVCYCQAVEAAAGIEIPWRAKFIRSLMLELERIHNHPLWLGIAGHIIAFDTVLMQAWRIREPVMWLCERITGNRKTYGMNLVGGVRRDVTREMFPEIQRVIDKIEKEWKEVIAAVEGDTPLLMRLKNVGFLKKESAINYAATGPTTRGSGVNIDSRRDHPYAAYERLKFKVITFEEEDIWARTLVRLFETIESIKIVRQCLEALEELPEGEILTEIEEEIPQGKEGISVVEAPRGEAIHYILTGEGNKPWRWRVRAPTYANLQVIPSMIENETIADVPIIIGSIDPCFSCTERMEIIDLKSRKVNEKIHPQI
ncbi:MAG: NADH-quinone oxidoreductase subunit C [Candidatus Edwardsbacteria bacterium]